MKSVRSVSGKINGSIILIRPNYLMYDQESLEAIAAEVRKLNETLVEKECS